MNQRDGAMVAGALLLWPMAALAQAVVTDLDPEHVRIATYLWVLGFGCLGWLASDLPKLAGWTDASLNAGNILKTRLEIVQGFISAELCGVGVFFLGKSSPRWINLLVRSDKPDADIPEMTLFVLVGLAGFFGTEALKWVRAKFFNPQQP